MQCQGRLEMRELAVNMKSPGYGPQDLVHVSRVPGFHFGVTYFSPTASFDQPAEMEICTQNETLVNGNMD